MLLGATGQIGGALLEALSRAKHPVTALVRNTLGPDKMPDNVEVLKRSEFTSEVLASALRHAEHAIYCLGPPEQFVFDADVFDRLHCRLLETFLQALRVSPVRTLTYVSTYEVFRAIDGVIEESHPIADAHDFSPYSQAKLRAYRRVTDFARDHGIALTTIHPAAVYGGRNTGRGITDYMENLASRKWYRAPFIGASSFPVIHVDSSSDLMVKGLNKPGAYIASDQMTSLQEIAEEMRLQHRTHVPIMMPLAAVNAGVALMEATAKLVPVVPLTSRVQMAFLTRGWRPSATKAMRDLGWKPMPLGAGIGRFLRMTGRIPTARTIAREDASRQLA